MKYVIKAKDGSYKRYPGDSLSSRYDDNGYSTWNIYYADLYSSVEEARYNVHEKGKFSRDEGASIVPVRFEEENEENQI